VAENGNNPLCTYFRFNILAGKAASADALFDIPGAHDTNCRRAIPHSIVPPHTKKGRHKKWDEAAIFLFVPMREIESNSPREGQDMLHPLLKETSKWQREHPPPLLGSSRMGNNNL